MAAIYHNDIVDIDLEKGTIYRDFLNHTIGSGDNNANWFGVKIYRSGEPVNLTGCSVQGLFMPSVGSAILISDGTHTWVNDNEASVLLPQACYNVKGRFTLAIKIIGTNSYSITDTVRIVDGVVADTNSESPVAPTESVPTYQEILSVYDQMVAVKEGSVRFDTEQSLTDEQKAQARDNISCASAAEVSDLKSAITEETRNLFSLDSLQIGKNAIGANSGTRAVSGAIFVSNDSYTVSCENLPSNLKYDIEAYSSNVITDRVKGITQWITSGTTVTTMTPDGTYTYIRILFGSVNDANLTESDFNDLKLQVEHGSIKTAYVEPITAVDIVARTQINNVEGSIGIVPSGTTVEGQIDELKNAFGDITEETRNLFSLDSLQIGKNTIGANSGTRAVSGAIFVSNDSYTVSCANLPSNLKYDIEAYSSNVITDRVKSITPWITSDATVTTMTPDDTYSYIRILFGSVNNNNLTTADFEGLKLQVELGPVKTPYVNPISVVDEVARAEIAEMAKQDVQKLKVMQFNVGHYGYGVQQGYSGDDAADVFKRYQLWLNDNACDIANINEYDAFFTSDHTISAKTDLFDPVFKYAYNNLITTLFSRYELFNQTWGYIGTSDPSSQRYYVKAYAKINDVQLCLVGCHLSPAIADAPAKRAVQIADLLALVQNDENVIIFGDFNVASTDEYAPIIAAGYKLTNGGNIGYFTTDYTGGDTSVLHPIDNIIVSPNIYISNIKVHADEYNQLTSDHYAVTCDLTIYPAS